MTISGTTLAALRRENRWKLAPEGSVFGRGQGESRIVRLLTGIPTAAEDLQALVAAIQGDSPYTNPKIGGRAYTGTWYGGPLRLVLDEDKQPALAQTLFNGTLTVSGVEVRDGYDVTETTTWYYGAAAVAALPDKAEGTLYERSPVLVDPDTGRYTYSVTTQVRNDQSVASGNATNYKTHSSAIAVYDGAASAPPALGAGVYGAVRYTLDRFGRYVGTREVITYKEDLSAPGWTLGQIVTNKTVIRYKYRQHTDGAWYYQTITYTVNMYQRSSQSDAFDDIAGGLVDAPAPYGGSRVIPLANNQYLAIKVTSDELTASWTPQTFP